VESYPYNWFERMPAIRATKSLFGYVVCIVLPCRRVPLGSAIFLPALHGEVPEKPGLCNVKFSNIRRGKSYHQPTMTPPQRTYIQKDGTIVSHDSRPLSARFSELVSSFILFLTLFWHSLFQVCAP
jgi:hypothetical protein